MGIEEKMDPPRANVPAYIADSEELPTPMAQTADSYLFSGGIQLFVALAGFIITVMAAIYCFCLRKEARWSLEQRDQIQKEKWEKRTDTQKKKKGKKDPPQKKKKKKKKS